MPVGSRGVPAQAGEEGLAPEDGKSEERDDERDEVGEDFDGEAEALEGERGCRVRGVGEEEGGCIREQEDEDSDGQK